MENKFEFIECEGIQVAAFIEGNNENEHPAYYPANLLMYVVQGQFNMKLESELVTVPAGRFIFIKKYTAGSCFKTWGKDEQCAIMYGFILKDKFINKAIEELDIKTPSKTITNEILLLPTNKILKGLFDNIILYINEKEDIDRRILQLKTKEAILGILKQNPNYITIFKQFAIAERADLEQFMQHNFQYNAPLDKLAQMTGRSLSTFNRDFRKIFNETPHRWIMQQRLNRAKSLLLTTNRMPSEIYLELGFEDLAHFSRTFKKAFGKTPTEVRQLKT